MLVHIDFKSRYIILNVNDLARCSIFPLELRTPHLQTRNIDSDNIDTKDWVHTTLTFTLLTHCIEILFTLMTFKLCILVELGNVDTLFNDEAFNKI